MGGRAKRIVRNWLDEKNSTRADNEPLDPDAEADAEYEELAEMCARRCLA